MNVFSNAPVRKAPQSRGMSASLRRLSARRAAHLFAASAMFIGLGQSSYATSGTWQGTTTDWNTNANWTGTAYPNATTDTATFSNAITDTLLGSITLSSPVTVQNILFTGSAGAYTIGAVGGTNGITLRGGGAGGTPSFGNSISIAASDTAAQVINANLSFSAPSSTTIGYTFKNDSTTTAATLSLTGAIALNTASNRHTTISLDGANTGANTLSGVITYTGNTQGNAVMQKVGTGTWILSGANVLTGNSMTNTGGTQGIQVNAGVLSAQNNQALGTSATANSLHTWINNGGTLQLANSITLDNGVELELQNGGTVQSGGSTTSNAAINVNRAGTAAASVTLSTVNASDVFTVGNAANDLTGGAADTVLHIAGPGTILLSQASNYLGGFSLDAGTTRLGSATALGAAATANVAFGAGSTGTLQLNGLNATVVGLNTNAATPGTATVLNGGGGTSILTVNNAAANAYAGALRDGTGGTLGLTKGAAGAMTLTGTNTYSGGTTVNGGTLFANSSSATGSGAVAVNSGGTLGGNGTAAGAVSVASSGHVAPGATAGAVGTLTAGSLTLGTGSILDFDLTNPTALDQIMVNSSNGLTINGGQLNINGGTNPFTTAGVYNLIGYNGTIGGVGVSALTLNSNNKDLANDAYSFGTAANFVTLTVAASGVVVDYYNKDGSANWGSAASWTSGVPNSQSAFAAFGGGGTPITAGRTVTVDGAYTVGTLSFNNANSGNSYTLAPGAGGVLTLDNGATAANLTDAAGSHTIAAPLTLTANGANVGVTAAADTLTVSGAIGGAATGTAITKSGLGTLALTGGNTYTGGTALNAGLLQINSAASLGDVSGSLAFGGGTLQLLADTTSARVYNTVGTSGATIDTNGHALTLTGAITPLSGSTGGLTKLGSGILTLAGANTYTGTTTINGGTLQIDSNAELGDPATGASLAFNGGTLATTAGFGLFNGAAGTNDRAVTLGTAGGALAPVTGTTLTVSGPITGSGSLTKADAGRVTVVQPTAGQNTFSGGTLISGGTVLMGDANSTNNGLGTGAVTLDGGTLSLHYTTNTATQTGNFANGLVVDGGFTGGLVTSARGDVSGALTGGGTLNVQTDYVRSNFDGNWSAFTGQINITPGAAGGDFRINNTAGFGTARINLASGTNLYDIVNFAATGLTLPVGELTGAAGSFLSGGPTGGRVLTYNVGGANTNAEFDGIVRDGTGPTAIIKSGTGVWTLTGANSYTGGTTVSAGALNINGVNALGGANYTALTLNGGALQYSTTLATANNGSADVSTSGAGTAAVVTIGANGGAIDTNGSNVTFANAIGNSGTGALTKVGAGILTLAGANTYTGATNVNGGTLAVTGSTGPGGGTVAGGATLTGTGTVGGTVVDNGTINPGAVGSVGTLTLGGLTLSSGSVLNFDLSGASTDLLTNSGAFTFTGSGAATVNFNVGSALTASSYTFANLGTGTVLSSEFSFTNPTGYTASVVGDTLVLNQNSAAPTATGTAYSLAATAGATNLRSGATTSVTSTITNTGTGTADTLRYTGLTASVGSGTITATTPSSGGPLAQGASGTGTATFTAGAAGTVTVGAAVGSATNATLGTAATPGAATGATINVYTGQETYTGTGGAYVTGGSNATKQAQWSQGGAAGIDAGFTGVDTATFGTSVGSGKAVVTLDGAGPNLNAVAFATGPGGVTLAQGTGGTVTLSQGTGAPAPSLTNTSGANAITAPLAFGSAGTITVTGGSLGIGQVTGAGATTVSLGGGTTLVSNLSPSGSAPGSKPSDTFGALSVTGGVATLDFGAGNAGETFTFNGTNADTFGGTLNIINYVGNPFSPPLGAAAGGGLDQLLFAPGAAHQLQNVYFINPSGQTGTFQGRLLSTGEVVAPEPSEIVSLGAGLLGIALLAGRRTWRRAKDAAAA